MGVLGGFKNMLRTWKNNLRKKKKKLQSKIKSFFYSFIAIVIYPISVVLKKENTITPQKIKKVRNLEQLYQIKLNFNNEKQNLNYKKQILIEKAITEKENEIKKENISKPIIEKVEQKKEDQEVIYKNSNNNYSNLKNNTDLYETIKKKIDVKSVNIKENIEDKKEIKKEDIISFNTNDPKKNDINILSGAVNSIPMNHVNKSQNNNTSLKDDKTSKNLIDDNLSEQNLINNNPNELNENKPKIIINIKVLDEFNELNKKIEEEINKFQTYNESYEITYKIKELKDKIEYLKQEYNKNNILFENNLSFENIEILENTLEKMEARLEEKKKELLTEKNKPQSEVKVEPEKKVKKEEKKKEINEIEACSKIVLDNINKCQKYYNDYLKELNKKNRKNTLFKYTNIISSSILSFLLGLIPFKFVRNKILKDHITAINVNNSIRLINNMINPKEKNYYLLFKEYKEVKELIESTYNIMNDSLERILKLKEYFIELNIMESDINLYNKILNIENIITENIKQMNEKSNDIDKKYIKRLKF